MTIQNLKVERMARVTGRGSPSTASNVREPWNAIRNGAYSGTYTFENLEALTASAIIP